jgi:hypothetical protein
VPSPPMFGVLQKGASPTELGVGSWELARGPRCHNRPERTAALHVRTEVRSWKLGLDATERVTIL